MNFSRHRAKSSKFNSAFSASVRRIPQVDPYGGVGLGDIAGNPIDDVMGGIRGQMQELKNGLTVAAACSTAAAIGVVLLLITLPRGGGRRRRR